MDLPCALLWSSIPVCIFGFIGNVLVIQIVYKSRVMHTPTNFLLVNMAVSDVIAILLFLIHDLTTYLLHEHIGENLLNIACKSMLKPMHVQIPMSIHICRKQDSCLVYGTKTDSLSICSFRKQCFCVDSCDFFLWSKYVTFFPPHPFLKGKALRTRLSFYKYHSCIFSVIRRTRL